MNAMLPAHLSETLNNLGDAAREVANEVRADKEQRAEENRIAAAQQRRHNRRTTILLIIVSVLVASLVTLAITNRRLNQANASTNRQNAQIIEQIQSCTTKGGECYEQNSQQAKELAAGLLRSNIAVAICARISETEEELMACVEARLTQPSETEDPPPAQEEPGEVNPEQPPN